MTFNSIEFLIFYPIVLLLYFVLPRVARWPMLLVASYYFYMCYDPALVVLILTTTLVSWLCSIFTERTEKRWVKRTLLIVTLVVSLGVLFFYKYFDFLSVSVAGVFSTDPVLLNLVLPVGISFYTFQTLSYVIDVYRGNVKTERNFFFYALFVSFFPQLVAGPIERPDNLIPQLREAHGWDKDNAIKGAKHMIVGFFKKICVADTIAVSVNAIYNNPTEATTLGVVIATVLFAVQIYCDFSGYTDIAIGCARIMGIRLMKNFDHPYTATTIKEFWARWHISLSSWFRDYLYIPLGGSRCPKWRHLMNLFIVFLVSGLWHGANWTFVIWGAIHGVYQVIGNLTAKPRRALIERCGRTEKSLPVVWIRRVITFALVAFAWIFFRANNVSDAFSFVGTLFSFEGSFADTLSLMELDLNRILLVIASLIILFITDRALKYEDVPERLDESRILTKNGSFVYYLWAIIALWVLLVSQDLVSSFIYFQF